MANRFVSNAISYHGKGAINEIAPFEDIVMDGKFFDQAQKAYKNAHIKGMKKGTEPMQKNNCFVSDFAVGITNLEFFPAIG